MSKKEIIEELQDIKKLLVLQLIAIGVKQGEIEAILELGNRNFSKYFNASKLVSRLKDNESDTPVKKKVRKSTKM